MLVPTQTLSAKGHLRTYNHFFCDSPFCLLVKLCIHTFLWMLSRKQTQTLLKVKIGFFICLRSPACGHCSQCTFLPMECF